MDWHSLWQTAQAWQSSFSERADSFASSLPQLSDKTIFAGILTLTLILLMRGKLRYDFIGLLCLFLCVAFGLVPSAEAFLGFSHPAVITVAAILVLSRPLSDTRILLSLELLLRRKVRSGTGQVFSLSAMTAALSGFMNNVGALTMMMPMALRSGARTGVPASRLLMPASFASLLGGMITLIGTPPNLIIAGVRERTFGEAFGLFDFFPVGICIALAGIAYLTLFGWRFLPSRPRGGRGAVERAGLQAYVTELRVERGIRAAGMRLSDLEKFTDNAFSVLAVVRSGHKFLAPPGYFMLSEGDVVLAEADSDALSETMGQSGLTLESGEKGGQRLRESDILEAVVTNGSRLIGHSAANWRMRQRLGVNLIGVSRRGETIVERVRELPIRTGDVLLLQGPPSALEQAMEIAACVPLRGELSTLMRQGRGLGLPLLFLAALFPVGFGWIPPHFAFPGVIMGAILLRQIQAREVYEAIDWPVVIFIAAMLPVGAAFETSGASGALVGLLEVPLQNSSPQLALLIMMVVTMLLSDILNNAATAVLMASVALGLARTLGVDPDPFLMAVAVAASSTFLTPIGHQSNLIVMGPGGYRFSDYWRVGLLLDGIVLTISWFAIPHFWPLNPV